MNARVVDHEQAIKSMMAERYLLGELAESDLEAYEEHLFACPECFEQVKAGTEFVTYLKRFDAEEAATGRIRLAAGTKAGWRQLLAASLRPVPALAVVACLLAATSIYQNVAIIEKLKAPQIESRYMLTEQSRDGEKVVRVPRNSRIRLAIEFQPREDFVSYETQIVGADGKITLRVPFLLQASQDMIEVSLYAGSLKPGRYFMLVQGTDRNGSQKELARDPFQMQFQD